MREQCNAQTTSKASPPSASEGSPHNNQPPGGKLRGAIHPDSPIFSTQQSTPGGAHRIITRCVPLANRHCPLAIRHHPLAHRRRPLARCRRPLARRRRPLARCSCPLVRCCRLVGTLAGRQCCLMAANAACRPQTSHVTRQRRFPTWIIN